MSGSEDASPPPPPPPPLVSSIDSLFRGGTLDLSPGPMTLLSSFFADDSDADSRSFSQLLAGAIDSSSLAPSMEAGSRLDHLRSPDFPFWHDESPLFTVPPGMISPTLLLDSRAVFSSSETFGTQSNSDDIHVPRSEHRSLTTSQASTSAINLMPSQQSLFSDQRSQHHHPVIVVDKPADDGYNWRKYGQKQVKGSEYPRSYYKCTQLNCLVKKKVERDLDGQIIEIIYKGRHNHQKPSANKRVKELNENSENDTMNVSMSKRDREYSSSDDEEEADETEGKTNCEPNAKRMNVDGKGMESSSTLHKKVTEPRIIVQTTSEVDLLDDGYRWRKYGQKVVKGNPHPRSYYKCTSAGCNVRKHVERASSDAKAVMTTYEGRHNHEVPAARNSSHITNYTPNANVLQPKAQKITSANPATFFSIPYFSTSDQRPLAALPMKQEHGVTQF